MYCMNCGKNITDGSKFCPECGTPVQKKSQTQQAAPVQQAASAKPVKVKKKHPVLITVIILLIIWCAAVPIVMQIIDDIKTKPKTYDFGSFTIDLPPDMSKGYDDYYMGNEHVVFDKYLEENDTGYSASELADDWEKSLIKNGNVHIIDRSGNAITYTFISDKSLSHYYDIYRVYCTDDEIIKLIVGGRGVKESDLIDILDTVVIK